MRDLRADNPHHKKLRPKAKQRRENVRKFQREKTQNSEHKLAQNIHFAEKALDEVKELAKVLRPFLTNGAILLGNNWDQIMEDQIRTAIDGVIKRPMIDPETGDIVKGEDRKPKYIFVPVDPKDQMAARKHLIETFPKLIPESAKQMDVDPMIGLAKALAEQGGKMALEVEVEAPEHEPDDDIVEAFGRIIDNDPAQTIQLDTANA